MGNVYAKLMSTRSPDNTFQIGRYGQMFIIPKKNERGAIKVESDAFLWKTVDDIKAKRTKTDRNNPLPLMITFGRKVSTDESWPVPVDTFDPENSEHILELQELVHPNDVGSLSPSKSVSNKQRKDEQVNLFDK